jgi:predicted HicB family RNase H-like nuclease
MESDRSAAARVEFDPDDRTFVGHLAGIRDVVGFHGTSVDDYLASCEKLGQSPEKPFSGRVMFRIDPEIHARATRAAQLAGMSLEQWGEQALRRAVEKQSS